MTELIGQIIGNYRIEALLGRGGMGQVFRARHIHLDRPAAVKVIHTALASDATFQARFQQEARAAARLNHPHIVTVYDYGEQADRAYLAMELIHGGSLRDWLRQMAASGQGWPLATSIELVRQAAEALDYAHAQSMVHRDIKPDNLLLEGGAQGQPLALKVGDFGLARLTSETHLTAAGTALGTPAYMSPEQCRGSEMDGRSDIYSLGVVLYELACGRVPFVMKSTPYDVIYQHLNNEPPPPRQFQPDLPPALEAIILRCLAKTPNARFATAGELANALGMLLGSDLSGVVPIMLPDTLIGPAATVIHPPSDGAPPLDFDTIMPTTRPIVRVVDEQGRTLRVAELRGANLSIGRAPGNALVLDADGVSRHHLTLAWDGRQVVVTDLGASNQTQLDGQSLAASTPTLWPWGALARVGPYWLRLEPPAELPAAPPGNLLDRAVGIPEIVDSQGFSRIITKRLDIRPESDFVALAPGQAVPVRLTLINRGPFQDLVTITVSGVPESWVSGAGTTLLRPGEQAGVTLTVIVPPNSEITAGERLVKLRARSKEQPTEGAQVESRWNILPFRAVELAITPARATGRASARYQVTVRNTGNTPTRYQLAAQDEAGELEYTFTPDEVEPEGGQSATVRLMVGGSTRLVGARVAYRFKVSASSTGGPAAQGSAAAQFAQLALLPTWSIPAALGLIALILLAGLLPRPAFGTALAGLPLGFLNPPLVPPSAEATSVADAGPANTAAAIQSITQTAIQVAINYVAAVQPPTQTYVAGLVSTATAVAQTAVAAQTAAANATAEVIAAQHTAADATSAGIAQQTGVTATQLNVAANGTTASTQVAGTAVAKPTATVILAATVQLTEIPTDTPTEVSTEVPTEIPTEVPTIAPTIVPTTAPSPTVAPQPKLTVTTIVNNDNGGTASPGVIALSVTPNGGATSSVTTGQQNGFSAGSYIVSGALITGYTTTISGDCAANGSITLAGGDVKSCIITYDDIQPKLTVTTIVKNDNGGTAVVADFPLFVTPNGGAAQTVTSGQPTGFNAGAYTVGGASKPGYTISAIGGGCAPSGSITLAVGGGDKSCTITYDDQPGTLIVKKIVINDNGGTKHVTDFSFQINSAAAIPFKQDADNLHGSSTIPINAGSYTVTEPAVAGYAQSLSPDCTGTIASGETKTCTITNDDF